MNKILDLAKKITVDAGAETLKSFKQDHTLKHKGEATNFATEADLASEKLIFTEVKKRFPDHNFISEEMGFVKGGGKYTWVVDPIDGTFNFSHGQPLWGVECAVFEGNEPIIGVMYFPVLKELFYASKDGGAFLNQEKIKVSSSPNIDSSLVAFSTAYPSQRKKQKFPFENFMRKFDAITSISLSTAYDLAAVSCGRVDGFIEEITCAWDIAGGVVLIEEAGGVTTDWKGAPIKWNLSNLNHYYEIIGANRMLQPKIRAKFNEIL